MKKILFTFPQVVFERKVVEVTDEQAEALVEDHNGREKFIWDNMGEEEQSWCPRGSHGIAGFLECDLIRVELAPDDSETC